VVYLLVKYELMNNVTVVVVIINVVGLNIIPSHKNTFYIQCVIIDDLLNIKLCALKWKTGVFLQKISTAVGTNTILSLSNVSMWLEVLRSYKPQPSAIIHSPTII